MKNHVLLLLSLFFPLSAMEHDDRQALAHTTDTFSLTSAHAFCTTNPSAVTHEFHVVAQKVARTYKKLFEHTIAETTQDPAPILEHFLHTCPAQLLPYINCYFYLLFTHAEETCQCAHFKNLVTRYSPDFIHSISSLPEIKDHALYHACFAHEAPTHDNYFIYLLALGANPEQPVFVENMCRCCCESEFVPHFTAVPLIRFCKSSTAQETYQRLKKIHKKQTHE